MSRAPRMSLSASEELAAASAMTAEEYGAYTFLRMHQFEHGALPADEADRLARIAHVAAGQWPEVAAAIRPLFGPNWHHEATHQAREKASATRKLLSDAGRKGGRTKAKHEPRATPALGRAASQAASLDTSLAGSLALAGLKPGMVPRGGETSSTAQAGGQVPYPAIADPEAASAWLKKQNVFPADLDELQGLLMAGKLTPAILEPSAR